MFEFLTENKEARSKQSMDKGRRSSSEVDVERLDDSDSCSHKESVVVINASDIPVRQVLSEIVQPTIETAEKSGSVVE